jgi:hypothetical protein
MRVPSQRSTLLAVGGVVIASTVLVAGLDQDASSRPLAGTCTDADAQPAACTDPAAIYQVLTTVPRTSPDGDACPRGDYIAHPGGPGTLCLGFNAKAGDCIEDDPEGPAFVPCAASAERPTFRVLRVVQDRSTAKVCKPVGEAAVALRYSVPAKTLCIAHLPVPAPTE